jgi:L-cysteine desulfidase
VELHTFFENEVKPALGCTEPVAVALATARAKQELGKTPDVITLRLSGNIFKNGRDVGIPGTNGLKGNLVAAALGALAGDASKGLMVLERVSPEAVVQAKAMVDSGQVRVSVAEDVPNVFVEANLTAGADSVSATIADRHDKVRLILKNGKEVFKADTDHAQAANSGNPAYLAELMSMNIESLWTLAGSIDKDLEKFMLEGRDMNMEAARMGSSGEFGLGVGRSVLELGINGGDLLSRVKGYTGAAADVRMSGALMPIMSSAGSGNHGITAVVPLDVVAHDIDASPRQLAEALALSHLVTGFIKAYIGRLTPICGCAVAAGAGAAAGITRLLGGSPRQAELAVASVLASLMGMVCDGAKGSCALKVSAAAGEAYLAAVMAMKKRGVQQREGIVSTDMKTTAKALAELSVKAFANLDKVMVDILLQQAD